MNEWLATAPVDLYGLSLFQLVAGTGSFTQAAQRAGLTQSAVSRQIAAMEARVGTALFERTTRRVSLTPAGQFLSKHSAGVLAGVESALKQLREEHADAPPLLRIGLSRTVALAHVPGLLSAQRRRCPEVALAVRRMASEALLAALEAGELDAGVLCLPPRVSRALATSRTFEDVFTIIAPSGTAPPASARATSWRAWAQKQPWILPDEGTATGRHLRRWLRAVDWPLEAAMALDDFDLAVTLVAEGLGCAHVPRRALALAPRRQAVLRLNPPRPFARELAVVSRRFPKPGAHAARFVENVLF